MTGSRALRFVVATVFAVALASCGSETYDRTFRIGHDTAPLTLDPHHHNDNATWSVLSNLYDGLVRFDEEMRLQPALAESWRQVDNTHLRFVLRQGVRFCNGEALRPADVVASLERARTGPASKIRHHLVGVRAVRALDDWTVEVETDRPSATLLNRLVFVFVVPESDARRSEIERPIGTGPYRFLGLDSRGTVTMEGCSSWRGLPAIQRVELRTAATADELARQLFAGELDLVRLLPDDQLAEFRRFPHARAVAQPRLYVQMLAINPGAATGVTAQALADPRVRKALLAGSDRDRWVREVFRGAGAAASQFVHPVVLGFDTTLGPKAYDPAEARRLLSETRIPGELELPLEYTSSQRDLVAALTEDLAKIGLTVRGREIPWADLMRRARSGESPLTVFAWSCSSGDAGDFLNACAHSVSPQTGLGAENYSGYADPVTDGLIEAAEGEMAPARRIELLAQAQRRLLETNRVLPLTVRLGTLGASDRVEVVARHDQWLWVAAYSWRKPG